MAQRKLQQEIDKTIKKIQEGITTFQGTYDKLHQTANQAQKEKLEDNLKTQIKKLQRNRDQLKTWAAGNEVKDKKPLLDWRKAIENEMEKFKAVEKEMKTKAFSKEGLSAATKMDPKDKEKAEGCQFLSEMVEELERQIETLEAEEESLTATTKKGKKDIGKTDRLAEIGRLTERHKWHQNKLELLLRSLENGNVDIEQVNDIKDSIKYYVEENESPEFLEDDTMYDDFNLEQDEATWGIGNEADRVSSQDAQSVQDENIDPGEGSSKAAGKQKSSSMSEQAGLSARRPSNQMAGKPPLPVLATLTNPLTAVTNSSTPSSMKPAPPPARPPGETLKYASAAAAAASSDKSSIAPLPPPPGSTSTLAPLPPPPSKASASTSPSTAPSIPAVAQKPAVPTPALSTSQLSAQSPTTSLPASSSVPPTPALETSEPVGASKSKSTQSLEAPQEAHEQTPEPEEPEEPDTPPPPIASSDQPQTSDVRIEDQEESVFHLPDCLSDLYEPFIETKNRSTDPTSQPVQRLLNISYATCPDVMDLEKPRFYRPANKYDIPGYYPSQPAGILDDPALYERVDNDTLFFLFYYRQNTYQQHQAAKALKSQSWRFHKQYQTWFQRHEEPKTITEEYEQGTYRFFDYESTWSVINYKDRVVSAEDWQD